MSASLAVQKAIRLRLTSDASVTSVVPAASVLDRNARPNPSPSIILGEDQEVEGDDIARRNVRVYSTLHVWLKEAGVTGVKAIAGAIRQAVQSESLTSSSNFHFGDCRVSSARFIRDPDGDYAHAVVTVETLVYEVPS